jgi:hypothetical protein
MDERYSCEEAQQLGTHAEKLFRNAIRLLTHLTVEVLGKRAVMYHCMGSLIVQA